MSMTQRRGVEAEDLPRYVTLLKRSVLAARL